MSTDKTELLPEAVEVLVVGAGMAGLTAARVLTGAGYDVLVVDKGWNPGGRMATRRNGDAAHDHGATFIAGVGRRFSEELHGWREAGAASPWEGLEEGMTQWRGLPDMRGLSHHLALGLPIRTRTRLVSVASRGGQWMAATEDGATVMAGSVLLTPPVPQSLALLDAGETPLPERMRTQLDQVAYQRCLVVMAVPENPAPATPPGLWEPTDGPIARLVDERTKGTSGVPAFTIHARADYSLERWDDDRDEVAAELLAEAEPRLGSRVKHHQIHGWRYSRPERTWPQPCLVSKEHPPLVLAGDAFGGPDVPGAHRSGRAAAEALSRLVTK